MRAATTEKREDGQGATKDGQGRVTGEEKQDEEKEGINKVREIKKKNRTNTRKLKGRW